MIRDNKGQQGTTGVNKGQVLCCGISKPHGEALKGRGVLVWLWWVVCVGFV